MIETAFWLLATLLAYLHGGYAVVLALLSALSRRSRAERVRRDGSSSKEFPSATVLVGAYNEEAVLAAKLENLLAQDYPGRLDIVVVSDRSTDRTDDIARSYAGRGVRIEVAPERRGKAANFSAVVPALDTPVIVCTDAATRFAPDVVRRLATHFEDADVGLVGGRIVYRNVDSSGVSRGEGLYWRFEVLLRTLESRIGGTVVVSGACYAIRRELFRPVPAALPDDFMSPLVVWDQGFQVIFDPQAEVDEHVAATLEGAFRTKVRIISGNAAALWSMRHLLNPFRRPLLSLKLLSHRLLRWLVAPMLALMIILTILLLPNRLYAGLLAGQIVFYGLSVLGCWPALREKRLFSVPFYFCVVNLAAAIGVWRATTGKVSGTWEPVERGGGN